MLDPEAGGVVLVVREDQEDALVQEVFRRQVLGANDRERLVAQIARLSNGAPNADRVRAALAGTEQPEPGLHR